MTFRRAVLPVIALSVFARAFAADEPEQPSSHMKDVLKAKAAEEAKKKSSTPAAAPLTPTAQAEAAKSESQPAATATAPTTAATPAATAATPAATTATPAPTAAKAAQSSTPPAPTEPATMLPKVEVKKDRVTILDHNLAVQDKEIAREKKNTTPTELDKALNDPKVSKTLSIFGGQSGDYRAGVAKERVQMMEEEKQVMEAIAHAKTKEEKAELQKELDQLKALRRDLEKSLR